MAIEYKYTFFRISHKFVAYFFVVTANIVYLCRNKSNG